MYRLTVDGVEHYVVAIRNVFSNHLTTHKKFDLKGSTVDREASDKEKEKDLPTYKDNDFVKEGMKIYIGEEAKAKLIETLTADVDVSIYTQIGCWFPEKIGKTEDCRRFFITLENFWVDTYLCNCILFDKVMPK